MIASKHRLFVDDLALSLIIVTHDPRVEKHFNRQVLRIDNDL